MERQLKTPNSYQINDLMVIEEICRVWEFIADKKQGRIKFDELDDLFPHFEDIESILLQNKEMFWVSKLNKENWEIRAKWKLSLCSYYYQGKCCIHHDCQKLHICKDYLFGDTYCTMDNCKFSHEILDAHNMSALWALSIPKVNISLIRNSFPRLCRSFLDSGECTKLFCGYLHLCYKFVKNCCNDNACSLYLKSGSRKTHDLQSKHNQSVLKQFDLNKEKDLTIINNIIVCPPSKIPEKNFSLCKFYMDGNCNMHKRGKRCQHLHICKSFLLPIKKCSTKRCENNLSHDPLDEHNFPIVAERKLHHMEKKVLINLLRESFPKICKTYHSREQCFQCNHIHICPDYLETSCKKLRCDLSHDYKDNHNRDVLSSYGFIALLKPDVKDEYIKINILYPFGYIKENLISPAAESLTIRNSTQTEQPQTSSLLVSAYGRSKSFNPLKDEAICKEHIEGLCRVLSCSLLHSSTQATYIWQLRQKGKDDWQEFSLTDNENIEKQFCDPNKDNCMIGFDVISFQDESNGIFENFAADTEFRRLSTKSSVLGKPGDNNLTTWKWYWKEKVNDWREYTTGISSSCLEMQFVKKSGTQSKNVIEFSTGQFKYEIDIGRMKQRKLESYHSVEQKIRRRPVFARFHSRGMIAGISDDDEIL